MPRLVDGIVDSIGRHYGADALRRKHAAATTHGMRHSEEYRAWTAMIQRCVNPNVESFPRYGARGIRVCAKWRRSFASFLADVGRRPTDEHQLDRIDNNGPYAPGNVRWATRREQARNTSLTVRLPWDGRLVAMVEWAELAGLPYDTVKNRLRAGWPIDRIRRTPCRVCRRKS